MAGKLPPKTAARSRPKVRLDVAPKKRGRPTKADARHRRFAQMIAERVKRLVGEIVAEQRNIITAEIAALLG